MNIASPGAQEHHLGFSEGDVVQDDSQEDQEENFIRIKLYFYCSEKALRARVFPEEWYTVVGEEFGMEQATPQFQPWLEFSVYDHATFGEMLLAGICEANKRFEEMQSEFRFTEREDLLDVAERDMLFEIFQAKKKNGMPKEEEPSKCCEEVASV